MVKTFCDGCGVELGESDEGIITVYDVSINFRPDDTEVEEFEICSTCLKKIHKIIDK